MSDVKVQRVIITRLTVRGSGKIENPYKRVTEIWDFNGNKIAEIDPEEEKIKEGGKQ